MGAASLIIVLAFDLIWLLGLLLLILPLGFYRQAAMAVLKRNFNAYFINPTGYVFLALFITLTSFAAFWPHQFFASNLANFDQLNKYLPYILLVIIPAITMGAWAEERRQGTDELLLTLPTTDLDIVLGKYFASLFIYTVALVLSQFWNVFILVLLTSGNLDIGLLFATYLGYWFVGAAMLAIGLVASFMVRNLTVGFILGALFNAPLAFLSSIDVVVSSNMSAFLIRQWSLIERFDPFGRGLIGISAIVYFVMIVVFCLYIALILIGRRHWLGGPNSGMMSLHFVARLFALAFIGITVTMIVENSFVNRLRFDISEGKVSSVSSKTIDILQNLPSEEKAADGSVKKLPPIVIDAYISPDVPPEYAQTRFDLINMLREFDAIAGNRLEVRLRTNVEPFSTEASTAEKRFGIRATAVPTRDRGSFKEQEVIMGAVFSRGQSRVVVPFFEYGMPVEYELIRSINTVARSQRKTLGIVKTDAQINGAPAMFGPATPKQLIVTELEKQFTVEDVDPAQEVNVWIDDPENPGKKKLRYDAMLVVQPSSLGPPEMENLIKIIDQGQPIAIFEDPSPRTFDVPGTTEPKQDRMAAMMGAGGREVPKGDINRLWDLLGMRVLSSPDSLKDQPSVVWQNFNPYLDVEFFSEIPEFVFVRKDMPVIPLGDGEQDYGTPGFNETDDVTSGLEEVVFLFSSAIAKNDTSKLDFEPLVSTGRAGWLPFHISQLVTNRERNQSEEAIRLDAERLAGEGVNEENKARVEELANRYLKEKVFKDTETARMANEVVRQAFRVEEREKFYRLAEEFLQRVANEPNVAKDPLSIRGPEKGYLVLAARIRGEVDSDKKMWGPQEADAKSASQGPPDSKNDGALPPAPGTEETAPATKGPLNAIYVADTDVLSSEFIQLRNNPNRGVTSFRMQNVVFVLNIIDSLASETDYLGIRKKSTSHKTLSVMEDAIAEEQRKTQTQVLEKREEINKEANKIAADLRDSLNKFNREVARLSKLPPGEVDYLELERKRLSLAQERARVQNLLTARQEEFDQQLQQKIREIRNESELTISRQQTFYKAVAVAVPPIPLAVIGLAVFAYRRLREREGVSKNRLR